MKKLISSLVMLMLAVGAARAETVYVTDNLNLSIRSAPDNEAKVVKLIPTGTELTVVGEKTKSGFTPVRTSDGVEGFIQTRQTMKEPPAREQIETNNKTLKALQSENLSLKAELKMVKDSITPGTSLEKSLAMERDKLSLELNELKQAAAGVVQLKNERDELQERVVNAERKQEQLERENAGLKNTSDQDWFLYGGILVFFSVILGFILPKLGWRRKSSWDMY
ncbi:MAG: TIGR04211 family SH3 domain-containing protein [Methylovulum sp.]|uniref:TIGR04211 family SH3 domain-containing protein n=1 Tax=Methylovulum sp. TaxID=1916980 RepID=UPI00260B42EF|nr:TIGR04211 family SH3 domain-containing protein [Methylovulum sp.]MDD2722528.1 TIGR04211 family SH3 domain-containing protein [Methylovulum sp.]MDD5123056.1 TIGR04211 family SH3 domain-containing protein [Methylovulum sp.]